jgi:cobalamin biosynthesis Mg chelatase CobN
VLAQAAGSAGAQYNPGINGAGGQPEGGEKIAKKSESPQPTGGATAPPEGGAVSPESGGGSYTESPSSGSESEGTATAQKNESNTGQGKPEHGSTPGGKAKVQHAAPTTSKAPASDDDDGSSPLLPILIAVLVLAGISVAAFMIRQRRQRDGAGRSLSTKAG